MSARREIPGSQTVAAAGSAYPASTDSTAMEKMPGSSDVESKPKPRPSRGNKRKRAFANAKYNSKVLFKILVFLT
jgi:hypothetical protein